MKRIWTKSLAFALALLMAVSMAVPTPAQAASKKVEVKVNSPKKGYTLRKATLKLHTKKPVQLTVKQNGKNVTAKASYKSTNKRVLQVSRKGKITVKGQGAATVIVKYGKTKKALNVRVAKHNWKPCKKTVKVRKGIVRCNCGAILPELEKKDCDFCKKNNLMCADNGYCCCKRHAHIDQHLRKGENTNFWYEYKYQKVTYVDHYTCECGMTKAGEPKPKDD